MKKSESIRQVLKISQHPFAHLWSQDMETQVNVIPSNDVVTGTYNGRKWKGFKDGDVIYKSFRIPFKGNEWKDGELNFPLEKYADAIGMTGWNWKERKSIFVGYDFDSITNHKAGLETAVLDNLILAIKDLPWVNLIRSTSGLGYHIYVELETPVNTVDHHEHSALARSILSLMTIETGFDFNKAVDCCGVILWQYARRQMNTNGFTLIKKATEKLSSVPDNWKEYTTENRNKKRSGSDALSQIITQKSHVALDASHLKLMSWLKENAERSWWLDIDADMLVTHTLDLKRAHTELGLLGIFETNSSGSSEQNCFLFPYFDGSWSVRRYGKNVQEHPTWEIDPAGWTKTMLNCAPSFEQATGESVTTRSGDKLFSSLSSAVNSVENLGASISWEDWMMNVPRSTTITKKGDKLIVTCEAFNGDPTPKGWVKEKKTWVTSVQYKEAKTVDLTPDDVARYFVQEDSVAGWFIYTNGCWVQESADGSGRVLKTIYGKDTQFIMGKMMLNAWRIVNEPFAPEFPRDRVWNRYGATWRFNPAIGEHPHWDSILDHLGKSLNKAVKENAWLQSQRILTGADYLLHWLAFMVQYPTLREPYLFFCGPQNCGKSTLAEAFSRLVHQGQGFTRADVALKSDFNKELGNALFCSIEELDLSRNAEAYNKIKDWVTSPMIPINEKFRNPVLLPNLTHWFHTANSASYCPVFFGDTRITMGFVEELEAEIPKDQFFLLLEEEAPAFIYTITTLELPKPYSRLTLPALETGLKKEVMEDNLHVVDRFIHVMMTRCDGVMIEVNELFSHFTSWVLQNQDKQGDYWTIEKFKKRLPKGTALARGVCTTDGLTYVCNFKLKHSDQEAGVRWSVNEEGYLYAVDGN